MTSPITIRFTQSSDQWRVMCHPASGRCDIWRNGTFVRSTTYVPRAGLKDKIGLGSAVVPALLDRLFAHDQDIAVAQSLERLSATA